MVKVKERKRENLSKRLVKSHLGKEEEEINLENLLPSFDMVIKEKRTITYPMDKLETNWPNGTKRA